jgi:hypothetical protein
MDVVIFLRTSIAMPLSIPLPVLYIPKCNCIDSPERAVKDKDEKDDWTVVRSLSGNSG